MYTFLLFPNVLKYAFSSLRLYICTVQLKEDFIYFEALRQLKNTVGITTAVVRLVHSGGYTDSQNYMVWDIFHGDPFAHLIMTICKPLFVGQ